MVSSKLGWKVVLTIVVLGLAGYALWPVSETIVLGLDLKGGLYLTLAVDTVKLKQLDPNADEDAAVNRALEVIRSRVDEFGVAEPTIVREGENRIVVQLPGVRNIDRAKDLIRNTAQLEFKLVKDWNDLEHLPEGYELASTYAKDEAGAYHSVATMVLESRPVLTGEHLTKALVTYNDQGIGRKPEISIEFDDEGARIFEEFTASHIQERLAIVLDGKVMSAPVIKSRIPGGRAVIEGDFTEEKANDLRIILESGALPAPVTIIENRTIGPSLGEDSIRTGTAAGLIGLGLVVLFMLVYYKFGGLIANLALLLNVVILFGGLALLHATLTLPGIAGIILTIGMAVDTNVLIFERIREELRAGKTIRVAIDAGFDKAFSAIFDSNLTTIITAIALYHYGTGPIKGFAVTLILGLVANLFTGVFVSRLLFDLSTISPQVRKLSI